jgi:hypothetical protein
MEILDLKNTVSKISSLVEFNRNLGMAEESVSLKADSEKHNSEEQRERGLEEKEVFRHQWDNVERSNTYLFIVPEGEGKDERKILEKTTPQIW